MLVFTPQQAGSHPMMFVLFLPQHVRPLSGACSISNGRPMSWKMRLQACPRILSVKLFIGAPTWSVGTCLRACQHAIFIAMVDFKSSHVLPVPTWNFQLIWHTLFCHCLLLIEMHSFSGSHHQWQSSLMDSFDSTASRPGPGPFGLVLIV